MNNDEFKKKITTMGVNLNGIFSGYDLIINRELNLTMRMRRVINKPNLKPNEVVVIKYMDLTTVAKQIATDAIETVLALYDLQPNEDRESKVKELDKQIKHQIELVKFNIIAELIKEITPIRQKQLFYSLGMKNADKFVDGSDDTPTY